MRGQEMPNVSFWRFGKIFSASRAEIFGNFARFPPKSAKNGILSNSWSTSGPALCAGQKSGQASKRGSSDRGERCLLDIGGRVGVDDKPELSNPCVGGERRADQEGGRGRRRQGGVLELQRAERPHRVGQGVRLGASTYKT